MGEVVKLSDLRTPEQRVAYLFSLVKPEKLAEARNRALKEGSLIGITNMREALALGEGWQRAYESLESAHTLALAQWRSSETLLRIANEELERLRKVTESCA